jgi:hypothetical protein
MAVLHERDRILAADRIDRAAPSLDIFLGNPVMAEQFLYRDIAGEHELVRVVLFSFGSAQGFIGEFYRAAVCRMSG